MQSSTYALWVFFSLFALAGSPGDKRTILTSGEKVHTIHYQIGQSTVLFFGMKPDTVICGNKNYFNIEKIKEGLTIQPLSNFSTNLTVLTQGKRFLFFLTPAKGGAVDTFIDVRWVPESESRNVADVASHPREVVHSLNQKVRLGSFEFRLKRLITIDLSHRTILEFDLKNLTKNVLKTPNIEVLAMKFGRPLDHQVSVFEQDDLAPGGVAAGRLIVIGLNLRNASIFVKYRWQNGKIQLKGDGY